MNVEKILEGLNPAQKAAVTTTEGPLLVVAGAGSGKTRVITRRIAKIIADGVPGHAILAVTFTNKAAREMHARVEAMLGRCGAMLSTFHSFGARLLRMESARFDYPAAFSLYDRSDSESLLKRVVKDLALDAETFAASDMLDSISEWKSKLVDPVAAAEEVTSSRDEATVKVYARYEDELRRARAFDFDDLVSKTALLLETVPEVLDAVRGRFRYLLVDEYQDVNLAQFRLVRMLGGTNGNICVTGDPDQCIYSWRGADISYILDFPKHYPAAQTVRLEQNYRSVNTILRAASAVIRFNERSVEKRLFSELGDGEPIRIRRVGTDMDEARAVVDRILELRTKGARLADIAIFYRLNSLSYPLEQMLIAHRVPYQVLHGLEFFRRKEVKDVVAYLKWFTNPDDDVSLRRIINVPARGIGDKTVDQLAAIAARSAMSLGKLLTRPELFSDELTARARGSVERFRALHGTLTDVHDPKKAASFIEDVVNYSGLAEALRADPKSGGLDPLGNIEQLIGAAKRYDQQPDARGLAGFLEEIALQSDADNYETDVDKVVLMTVHAAKGLEFPHVIVVGMDKEIFPHEGKWRNTDVEEERRLFYVAMTRAMRTLVLFTAASRMRFGRQTPGMPSLFLGEIPESESIVVDDMDGSTREFTSSNVVYDDDAGHEDFEGPRMRKGTRVAHKDFGWGTVDRIQGRGGDARILVHFDESGARTLVYKYARLRVLDGSDEA